MPFMGSSRDEMAEERISKLEEISVVTSKTEMQREQNKTISKYCETITKV